LREADDPIGNNSCLALKLIFCLTCPVAALFIPHGLAYKAHPDLDDRADRIFHARLTLK